MGSIPTHTTMGSEIIRKMLREICPEAIYSGCRPMMYAVYNEKTNIFETKKGFIISIDNHKQFDNEKIEEIYQSFEKYLRIKVLLESDSASSIF